MKATETLQLADAPRLDPQVLLEITKSPGFVPVTATLLIVIEELVPLLRVAVCVELVEPTFTVPYERETGLMLTVPLELVPRPESATVCGLGLAESLKFNVAVRVPLAVGLNVMFAVQLADAAKLDPHVFEKILKSPAFVPESVMLLIVIVLLPLFVSVATFCPPMPPTGTDAQLKLVGDTDAANAAPGAIPHSATSAPSSNENRRPMYGDRESFDLFA